MAESQHKLQQGGYQADEATATCSPALSLAASLWGVFSATSLALMSSLVPREAPASPARV